MAMEQPPHSELRIDFLFYIFLKRIVRIFYLQTHTRTDIRIDFSLQIAQYRAHRFFNIFSLYFYKIEFTLATSMVLSLDA
jgi:hypothetical protein